MNNDFENTYPAGAAHAASEVDDYDGAAPEGAAIALGLFLIAAACVGAIVLAVIL